MKIHAKVGTGPHTIIKVKGKRKAPVKGDKIQFKDVAAPHGSKWEGGLINEIKDIGIDEPMFLVERW